MHVDVQIPPFEENSSGDRLSGGFFIHRATQNPHYFMTTGAFLTLLLSPVLYSILNRRRAFKVNRPDSLQNQLLEYEHRLRRGEL